MKKISLNGKWKCKPDIDNIGFFQKWYLPENYKNDDKNLIDIEIPKSYNLLQGFDNFEGIFWHFLEFELKEEKNLINFDYELRFNGVNYYTAVWINGVYLGHHFGGFTPFNFNVNKLIKKNKNLIVIRVDNNRKSYRIPSLSFDWFNWGGIYRDVDLLILEKNRIDDIIIRTKLITRQESRIEISYKVIGSLTLKWQILDDSRNQILFEGVIDEKSIANSFNVSILNPKLWSPDTPYLYYLRIYDFSLKSQGKMIYNTYFGIREIKVNGIYLYLNKEKIFLKGVNLHEEYMPYGRTIPYEKRKEDVKNIKKLGLNAIRTAHYSHDESLIEIADKLGILILEEIPVYQHCEFNNPFTLNIAANMLKELIMRDINHPSVIWWSVGNEVPLHKRECAKFIKNLVNLARELDNSRIITCVSRKLISDLTRKSLEVVTINTYFGWYFGHERMISLILDLIRTPFQTKPWIYTEFGAGAKYGFHADWNKQIRYSEEKQLQVLDHTIRTINSKEFFAGWFIWIYRDFKSMKRINKFQQGFNRKGLVSGEANEKKLIYYRLPMILNGTRKLKKTKLIGIILWIIFYPLSRLLFTRLIDLILRYIEHKSTYPKLI